MTFDDRLRDALRATAREPSIDSVAERVHAKRAHRRTVRRLEALGATAVVTAAVTFGGVSLLSDDQAREVAIPQVAGPGPLVRVAQGLGENGLVLGRRTKVTRVEIHPDEGYAVGPLVVKDGVITFAAYDRKGDSFSFPPSRIVRVRGDGTVIDRVDLQGQIVSLATGEGARWALTHDKTVIGPQDPEYRVKRIGPDNTVASNPVPPGELPVGDIVAAGGGVWVPVRDGVLHFDVTTGEFRAKIPLGIDEFRAVLPLPKGVGVTAGGTIQFLDPARDVAIATSFAIPAPEPNAYAPRTDPATDGWQLLGLVDSEAGGTAALAHSLSGSRLVVAIGNLDTAPGTADDVIELDSRLEPMQLYTDAEDIFVVGTLNSRVTVFQISRDNGNRTLTFVRAEVAHPRSFAFESQTSWFLSKGRLYQVHIRE